IVLIGDAVAQGLDGSPKRTGNENSLNALKDIKPKGLEVEGQDLQGVLNGDGVAAVEEGRAAGKPNSTTVESHDADSSSEISPDTPIYTATIEAEVDDLESGEWLGDVILTGVPAGFTVAITGGADA